MLSTAKEKAQDLLLEETEQSSEEASQDSEGENTSRESVINTLNSVSTISNSLWLMLNCCFAEIIFDSQILPVFKKYFFMLKVQGADNMIYNSFQNLI